MTWSLDITLRLLTPRIRLKEHAPGAWGSVSERLRDPLPDPAMPHVLGNRREGEFGRGSGYPA